MQQSQIITYGIDGVLAERLRELAQARRFWLRETSQLPACRSLLASSSPSVLVLAIGKDVERELALLEQVSACLSETRTIVVGDTDHPALAGLVWDLGATYALFPPTPVEMIGQLVTRILPAQES
jgi:DNA-binding NarL/FixJ family response regulator